MMEKNKIGYVYLATVLASIIGGILFRLSLKVWTPGILEQLLLSQAIVVAPSVVYLVIEKKNLREQLRFHKIKPLTVVMLVIFTYCILPLIAVINALSMLFSENEISGAISGLANGYPLILAIAAVALVPCILEESVYRGIFFNTYRKINLRRGILLSGLLFGLMHMNLNQFCYAFVMGSIFAIVIETTDSILSTMIMHFVLNANSTVMLYLLPKLQNMAGSLTGAGDVGTVQNSSEAYMEEVMKQLGNKQVMLMVVGVWLIIAIVPTVLAGLLLYAISAHEHRTERLLAIIRPSAHRAIADTEQEAVEAAPKESLLTVPLIIGMVICVIYMILKLVL